MTVVRRLGFGCVITAVVLASTAVGSARPVAVGCRTESGKRIGVTRDYRVTLLVGKVEDMYMPYQVRVNHLKHGEVMLRGRMTTGAMLTGGPIRHLEVQICTREARRVVTDANPKIVVDDVTRGRVVTLPVSVMEGIGDGVADLHYGNNIAMRTGDRFLVAVTWKGEQARFDFVLRPPR